MSPSTKRAGFGRPAKEYELTLDEIGALIKNGSTKRVLCCTGAGISTSAGIPDFRSPKTGLYHNLKRLNLDYPEQVFDIDFFRQKPEPFFELAKELYPGQFLPTLTHCFIRLLHDKGILLRCFTQNIDTLERRAGIPSEKIVEAHGSFADNHCIAPRCGVVADYESTKDKILKGEIPRCSKCKALVKPDIVFFGEGLPGVFFERISDFSKADLLIVMGTSLQVQPFASLPDRVTRDCPRVLINLENVGNFVRPLDVVNLSKCDDGVRELAEACGWSSELQALYDAYHIATKSNKELVDDAASEHRKDHDTDSSPQKSETVQPTDAEEKLDTIVAKLERTNL